MRVLFVQHDHTSPPGFVGERFSDRRFDLEEFLVVPAERYLDPGVEVDFPDPAHFDAVVPMGAPWSVYDHALIGSWVQPELDLLRRASTQGVPVLGLCFGGQLLAAAHGGEVLPSAVPEVGWHVVHSDEPKLLPAGPWFQWHFDRWTTPPAAREIARNGAASHLRRSSWTETSRCSFTSSSTPPCSPVGLITAARRRWPPRDTTWPHWSSTPASRARPRASGRTGWSTRSSTGCPTLERSVGGDPDGEPLDAVDEVAAHPGDVTGELDCLEPR